MSRLNFRIIYQHDDTGRITHKIIEVGQHFPILDERWFMIAVNQSTGLLDKNSKDIYEGDIWIDIISGMFYEVCFDTYNAKFSSRTKKDDFPKREDGYTYYNHCLRDIEVIGNICDNPELIK